MNYAVFLFLVLLMFVGTFWVVTRVYETRTGGPTPQSASSPTPTTDAVHTAADTDGLTGSTTAGTSLTQSLTDAFHCRLLAVTEDGLRVAVTDDEQSARFLVTGYDDADEVAIVAPGSSKRGSPDDPVSAYGAFPGPPGYATATTVTASGDDVESPSPACDADWHATARDALESGFEPVFDVRDCLPGADSTRVRSLRDRFDHAHVGDYPDGHLVEVTDGDRLLQVLVSPDDPPRVPDPGTRDDDDPWLDDALEYAACIDGPAAPDSERVHEHE
ncbi:hypothetical protein [Haloarchaeobius sp. DT45]|uniref:hypothetical protein n=1 Tax=Haloarchaeobius sp. DT45 TaxID=3446116 RepID=UPI003F6BE12E